MSWKEAQSSGQAGGSDIRVLVQEMLERPKKFRELVKIRFNKIFTDLKTTSRNLIVRARVGFYERVFCRNGEKGGEAKIARLDKMRPISGTYFTIRSCNIDYRK